MESIKYELKEAIRAWADAAPLAAGTPVWVLDSKGEITETTIAEIYIDDKGARFRLAKNSIYLTALSALGRTVFLTREEAEGRLEFIRGGK